MANVVKQDCIAASTLFSTKFSARLIYLYHHYSDILCRPISDHHLLDFHDRERLQAKTKVQTGALCELLYADNMDKNATRAKVQGAMDLVSQPCTCNTMTLQSVHMKPYKEESITVNEVR